MTPGLSAWADFQPFLQSIASVSQERRHNPQAIYHVVEANLPVRDTTLMDTGVISVVAGTIDSIMTGGSNDVQRLRLPDFLVANGKPDEVWLSTFSAVPEGEPPFRLILLYHRGIVARFELAEVPIIGGNIIGCYGRGSAYYVLVWLVSPDQQVSFQQALESSELLDPIQPYQRLEEATDLDVDAFFEEFTRNDRACLETPEGRW